MSSERRRDPDELVTFASGPAPAALIDAFAAAGNHSIVIETRSARLATGIRLGNTGVQQNLPRLDRRLRQGDRQPRRLDREEDRRLGRREIGYSAAWACLASIWSSAETTASKVSKVEAWRAL